MKVREYKLSEISNMKYGKMLAKGKFTESGYPVYSGYRITGYTDEYLYEKPMVVVVARGVGGTGDVKISPPKAWVTNLSIVLDTNDELVDKYFLYCMLNQEGLKDKLDSGASISQITISSLEPYKIQLPSLEEQMKVTTILKCYDNLIENNNRRIAILEDMAQSLYREWFVHFRFPGHKNCQFVDSELGRIPEGWEVKPIAEEIEILGGGTPKKSESQYWDEEVANINWYTPSNLTKHSSMFIQESDLKITDLGLKKSSAKLFPAYSVMMTSRATIGVISINTTPACTNQGFIVCVPNERVSTEYIHYWLIANMQSINNLASGATFKEVRRTLFKELPFLIPNKDLMNKFNESMKPLTRNIEVLISKNKNLKTQRDMLLPKLINGNVLI